MITNNNTCTYLHLEYWSTNWHFRNLHRAVVVVRKHYWVVLVSYNENLIALKEHTNAIVSYISYDKALFAQSPFVIRFQLWRSNCCRFVGSMCQIINAPSAGNSSICIYYITFKTIIKYINKFLFITKEERFGIYNKSIKFMTAKIRLL